MPQKKHNSVPDGWEVVRRPVKQRRARWMGIVDDSAPAVTQADVSGSGMGTLLTGATGMALARKGATVALPAVKTALEEVATNPSLVSTGKKVGQAIGGVAGVVKAGPLGVDAGARIGGRLGASTAKIAQGVAAPIVKAADSGVLQRLAPYGQTLSTLSGAQGVLDLAQMAEPDRTDIGFLGVGRTLSDAQTQSEVG